MAPKSKLASVTWEHILDLYKEEGNHDEVARKLGCSGKTLQRWLKKHKRLLPREFRREKPDHGELAKWLRAHPHESLPRSVAGIASKTGISPGAVRQYLWRRRVRAKAYYTANLEHFLKEKSVLQGVDLRKVSRVQLLKIDRYNFKAYLRFILKDGSEAKLAISERDIKEEI